MNLLHRHMFVGKDQGFNVNPSEMTVSVYSNGEVCFTVLNDDENGNRISSSFFSKPKDREALKTAVQGRSFEWETLGPCCTIRAKVFGGWLVQLYSIEAQEGVYTPSCTFVPDPNHEWEVA